MTFIFASKNIDKICDTADGLEILPQNSAQILIMAIVK